MSFYQTPAKKKPFCILKSGVIHPCAGSEQQIWASGLVVMTSRLQRGDRQSDSGLAHYLSVNLIVSLQKIFINITKNNINIKKYRTLSPLVDYQWGY